MILSSAQRELLTKSPHLVPVADLGDGDVLALDITTGDETYGPYVVTINGYVQAVDYHYRNSHNMTFLPINQELNNG